MSQTHTSTHTPAPGVLLDLQAGQAEQGLSYGSPLAVCEADGSKAALTRGTGVIVRLVVRERFVARPLAGPAVVVDLVPASYLTYVRTNEVICLCPQTWGNGVRV